MTRARRKHPDDLGDLASRARSFLAGELAGAARVRPFLYWADMVGSALLGWTLTCSAALGAWKGLPYVIASAGAVFAQMRALAFLHEISHGRSPRLFHPAWNLVVGIPLGVPSILYLGSHPEHHRVDRFATESDPEYAPISQWSPLRRIGFVATGALVPLLLVLRWGVLAPLSVLDRRLRTLVLERCSTLVINPSYSRRAPSRPDPRRWLLLESAATAWVWTLAGLSATGAVPVGLVAQWFVVVGGVFALNQVRTLVAHGYASFGSRVDRDGQFHDSIDLAPSPLAVLIAPLGLRYHALHHLLPELPYHALGPVHRALSEGPSAGSPYPTARSRGIGGAFCLLVRRR